MSYRAIIMEITPEYCLAMAADGIILRIRYKEGVQVGDCVYVLESDLWERQPISGGGRLLRLPAARSIRNIGSAAAVVVICFALALYNLTPTVSACSVLSIDGRNSVQVELDESNRILTASMLHGEPPEKQSVKSLTGKSLPEALKALSMAAGGEALLAGYAVLDDDPQRGESLRKFLNDAGIISLPGTAEDVKEAHKQAQSLGFYVAERALKDERIKNGLDDRTVQTLEKLVDNREQSSQNPGGGSTLPVLTPLPNSVDQSQSPSINRDHLKWNKHEASDKDEEDNDRDDKIDRDDGDSDEDDDEDDRDSDKDEEIDKDDRDKESGGQKGQSDDREESSEDRDDDDEDDDKDDDDSD